MIIDLTAIADRQKSFDFLLPREEINLEDEAVKLNDAVRIEGELTKGIVETNVKGKISADIELDCSRCLQPIHSKPEIHFEVNFVTPENYTQEREAKLNLEDLEVSIFDGDKIDLSEIAREQILLAIPVQIFCQADCKGLCGKCGASLNLIDCNCEEKEVDPRWQGLRDLSINNEK
jgi:uncharacterized protein